MRPTSRPENRNAPSREEIEAWKKVEQDYRDAYEPTIKKDNEEKLRLQVHDFLAWLKAQGVM